MKCHHPAAAGLLALFMASVGQAQTVYTETEPNESRSQANPFTLSPGDSIQGESHGTSLFGSIFANGSFDYFAIQSTPQPLGIYRHTLTVAAPSACAIVTIGYSQIDGAVNYRGSAMESNGGITASGAQGATPAYTAVWYGFGRSETCNLRVQNSTTTSTNNYTATYGRTQVTPIDIGTFPGGQITVSTVNQGHVTDTALWVFDSTLHAIPGMGNDDVPDPFSHTVKQSTASKELLTPGTYYLALCDSVLMVDHECGKPPADRQPNSAVADPDTVQCTSTAINRNLAFALTDGSGAVHQFPVTKNDGFEVKWIKFTLTAPVTGACCNPDGTCSSISQSGCAAAGGTYSGNGVACGTVSCTQPPTGACCALDGTCSMTTQYACTSYSGAWKGAGVSCSTAACPGVIGRGDSGVYTPLGSGAQQGGLFIDVTAGAHPITVNRFDLFCVQAYNNAPDTAPMEYFIFDRTPMAGDSGSYMGYEGGSTNPGGNGIPPTNTDGSSAWELNTDSAGLSTPGNWTSFPVFLATPVTIQPHATRGFWIASHGGGIGWFNGGDNFFTGTDGVTMYTQSGKVFPYQSGAAWASNLYATQASFNGRIYYSVSNTGPACYANCDGSTTAPVLNVGDFTCFLQKYAASDPYANCDGSTTPPVLNVGDFTCFLQKYAAGCP
jgi:hypothetical protein